MSEKKTIGITGGIGSGKSIVSKILRTIGYPVYDSDIRARELMETNPVIRERLTQVLGEACYAGGNLDRKWLAARIFGDPGARELVNSIVHPIVRSDFRLWVEEQMPAIVFQESALLFETGGYQLLDFTILVTAPFDLRIQRVVKRDGSHEDQVRARIESQLPDERKLPLADFVIDNGGSELIIPQILSIIRELNAS